MSHGLAPVACCILRKPSSTAPPVSPDVATSIKYLWVTSKKPTCITLNVCTLQTACTQNPNDFCFT